MALDANRMTDSVDDLAAFLMHRTADPGATDAERLEVFAAVEGYQEGDDPPAMEAAMRTIGLRYADHPGYRPQWRPDAADAP